MEEEMRIYITGASCAGVTTLGQTLAVLRPSKFRQEIEVSEDMMREVVQELTPNK
jgi:uridine kinase